MPAPAGPPRKAGWTDGEFTIHFEGRDRAHVRRKALDYWYRNRAGLGLTLQEFFAQCRLSIDGTSLVFHRGAATGPR